MLGGETPQRFYDVGAGKRAHDRKRYDAMIRSLQRSHRLRSIFKYRKDGFGIWKKGTAGFGKEASTLSAFQQRHSELLL